MAEKKKRLCPNIAKGTDGKPKCGKEFEYDPEDFSGRCPHCGFNVIRYDDERSLDEVRAEEKRAAEEEEKKKKPAKKGGLGRLADLR
jgi:DNA-directed RNA polymerase subunit RPC12/RpoP